MKLIACLALVAVAGVQLALAGKGGGGGGNKTASGNETSGGNKALIVPLMLAKKMAMATCSLLKPFDKKGNETKTSEACKNATMMFDMVVETLQGKVRNDCVVAGTNDLPLKIVLDLQTANCSGLNITLGCAGYPGALSAVVALLPCVLAGVPSVLKSVFTILGNLLNPKALQYTWAMICLILYAVINLLIELLTKLPQEVMILLCPDVPIILIGAFLGLNLGLAILLKFTIVLNILIFGLLGLVLCILWGVLSLVTCILSPIAFSLTFILSPVTKGLLVGLLSSLVKSSAKK